MNDNFVMRVDGIAIWCYRIAIFIAYLGSLNPWFFWGLGRSLVVLPPFCLLLFSFLLFPKNYHLYKRVFYPLFFLFCLSFYMLLRDNIIVNVILYRIIVFFIFFFLFIVNDEEKIKVLCLISKLLACILLPSLLFFVLYILGLDLPHISVSFNDGEYNYENYFFFLLDDRSALIDIPRFHSVFLEPAHIGVTSVMLLLAQSFDLKKWYNIVLLVTIILTFSLAAYLLLGLGFYFTKIIYKNFFVYSSVIVLLLLSSYFIAISYNNGDNMFNNLIFERLIVEDGKLSGDNRVGDQFLSEYENFVKTDKVFWGVSKSDILNKFEGGNAGYRVYIYQYGIFGVLLSFLFYLFTANGYDKKISLMLLLLNSLIFWKGGTPLWFNLFIPYILGLATLTDNSSLKNKFIIKQ